jgi:hypothetical protein
MDTDTSWVLFEIHFSGDELMPRRNRQDEQGDQSRQHWENWNEPYQHIGGRGWREGWDDAMHHEEGPFCFGPRNYKRPDNRIEEDVVDSVPPKAA